MRYLPAIETEVLVVGHGATGLFAAIELASTGHEVLLVGNGTPSSEMSTGCISFPDEEDVVEGARTGRWVDAGCLGQGGPKDTEGPDRWTVHLGGQLREEDGACHELGHDHED